MMLTKSLGRTERAQENRAWVRQFLSTRQPTFAAALAAVERDFVSQACPCRQGDECGRTKYADHRETR
jgi:hypothetical protein